MGPGVVVSDLLTREQIDTIVDGLTMGDVQEAFVAGVVDKAIAGVAFARAARRSGLVNGKGDPLDHVSFRDLRYLVTAVQGAISDTSPKSEDTPD